MSAASQLESRLRDRLAQLRADNLTRVMRPPAGVDLSSNDYLQLSMHPAVTAAFAAGLGLTALLQSSTATALITSSFTAEGLVSLVPALAIMLGANVGTTLIVQVLSFNIAAVAPVLFIIGLVAFRNGPRSRIKDLGRVAILAAHHDPELLGGEARAVVAVEGAGPVAAPTAAQRPIGDGHPGAMKGQPGQKDELAGDRADGRALPELADMRDGCGVDQQLADIGGDLDREDPAIVAPEPAPGGFHQADVQVGTDIVVVEDLVPAIVDANALAAQDRPEELQLHDMGAQAPEVEEAVAARLDRQEHRDQQAHQGQRQRRGRGAAEGHRECYAGGDHRPVGGGIEAGAPDGAAVDLAPVQVGERADVGGAEHRLRGLRPIDHSRASQLLRRPTRPALPA